MTARRRNHLLLRLDAPSLETVRATYDNRLLTIEHVLPQTVDPASNWQNTLAEKHLR